MQRGFSTTYAHALLAASQTHGNVRQVVLDAQQVATTLRRFAGLRRLLLEPRLTDEKKKHLLQESFGQLHPLVSTLLWRMVQQRAVGQWEKMVRALLSAAQQRRLVLPATLHTTRPATKSVEQAVIKLLAQLGYQEVALTTVVDPQIGAGLLVKMPDAVLDRSLAGALRRLQTHLAS